jgi:NhaP-type Na+/H+ or K+/H+ antiporter
MKGLYAVGVSLFIMIAGEFTVLSNSTLLACMSFGFTCFQFWGNNKPAKQINDVWWWIQPCLFGTVGAQLLFRDISLLVVEYSVIIVFAGMIVRMLTVIIVVPSSRYTFKERVFMGAAFLPKASLTAAFGVSILTEARIKGYTSYIPFGVQIETTAILSVLISAPLSVFLVSFLGPRSLEKEGEFSDTPTTSSRFTGSRIISKFEIKEALIKIERQ